MASDDKSKPTTEQTALAKEVLAGEREITASVAKMDDNNVPPEMRNAIEQAKLAGVAAKTGNLPTLDVNDTAIGAQEGVSPVNTPGYEPGHTGVWNPAVAPVEDVTQALAPEPTAETSPPGE